MVQPVDVGAGNSPAPVWPVGRTHKGTLAHLNTMFFE